MTERILAMVKEMALPIAKGALQTDFAIAALAASLARAKRDGTLQGTGDLAWQINAWSQLLGQFVHNAVAARARTSGAIGRTMRDLIGARKTSNVLFAEAHNINADNGFVLTEAEVVGLVDQHIARALREHAKGRGRHGRS